MLNMKEKKWLGILRRIDELGEEGHRSDDGTQHQGRIDRRDKGQARVEHVKEEA